MVQESNERGNAAYNQICIYQWPQNRRRRRYRLSRHHPGRRLVPGGAFLANCELDTPRIPLVLYEGPNRVADAQQVVVTLVDLSDDARPGVWTGQATNYSDYAVPYWVIYPDLPHAGLWGLHAEITRADGATTAAQAVIEVAERPQTLAVGRHRLQVVWRPAAGQAHTYTRAK